VFLYAGEALCEAWNPVCIGKIDGVIGKDKSSSRYRCSCYFMVFIL